MTSEPLVHASIFPRARLEGAKRVPNLAACKLLILDQNSEADRPLSKVLKVSFNSPTEN
jgi:hypothetical protein